jgi:isoamylase/glycogen operon protein
MQELTSTPIPQIEYAWQVDGPHATPGNLFNPSLFLSDPYAKSLSTSHEWGQCLIQDSQGFSPRGRLVLEHPFDWQKDEPPNIPPQELILYEMHVRAFTQSPTSKVKYPGTFLGIIEKIPHLKALGINAVELLPIFEFNECENHRKNPKTKERLVNFWGYSTINFFTPMQRYATSSEWGAAISEFKTLVRELHKNGIEVILDVVYNHTAEGGADGPCFSFRGIDNKTYYILSPDGKYLDFTGTANTFNANHPIVIELIIDSLRYWVTEMHVDGFRFDLASALTRDEKGVPLLQPPLIEAISFDPVLANVKLIAEAWDAAGLYQVGNFPSDERWAEWNGKYRDITRRFLKGTDGLAGEFAKAVSGSQDLYGKDRSPYHSINFVTAHDGFSLRDLVSYNTKHNEQNGEDNRDGLNENDSWNCGVEGPTANRKIIALRARQMRNFHAALMLSLGTPMLLMGDEYGHTRRGNNNVWCQDNALNYFLWDELEQAAPFFRFYQLVIQLRKTHWILQRVDFLDTSQVDWHGLEPLQPNWGSKFLAWTLKDSINEEHLYIAFNAQSTKARVHLPTPPPHKKWYRILDTSLPSPDDFLEHPTESAPLKFTYDMSDHSVLVAKSIKV